MMKKLLIPALAIALTNIVFAQQIPNISHFMYDNLRTNPGSTGSMDMICVTGIMRQQMVGFPGNPDNFFFNAEAPFNLFGAKHGVGLSIYRDALGLQSDINLSLSYAFRFNLGDGTLGIGLNGGFIDNTLAADQFNPQEDVGQDPNIPQGDPDGMTFTLGAGLFYRSEEIYFGASVLNLNSPTVTTSPTQSGTNESSYNLTRHYYVTAGYNMQLNNPAWELKPAVLLISDEKTTQMDLNLTVAYNKKFWGGVSYRTGSAVIGMIGLQLIEGLKVGYSYDFNTSALMNHNQGSHEVLLNYCFKVGVEKAPQKYKSIRYL
jgi:type IX secretion system PorP/SprF family membrane protein